MFGKCKGCESKDLQIQDLKTCPVCAQKDLMISFMKEQIAQRDITIAQSQREYKRAMDRVLEKEGIQPIREEVAGEKQISMDNLINMFEEVPVGEVE
jgi:hypothetical protein